MPLKLPVVVSIGEWNNAFSLCYGLVTYKQRNDPHRSRRWTSILEIAETKHGKNSRLRRDSNSCLPERTNSAQLSTELRRHKLGARQMFDPFFCYSPLTNMLTTFPPIHSWFCLCLRQQITQRIISSSYQEIQDELRATCEDNENNVSIIHI